MCQLQFLLVLEVQLVLILVMITGQQVMITTRTFVRERSEFLNFPDNHNIKNVIFIATDVHFAANVKVVEDPNHDGNKLLFYELTNGPLSTFAKNTTNPLDLTLHANYLYNESAIFNFGHVIINKTGGNTHFTYH